MVDFKTNPLVSEDIQKLLENQAIDWKRFAGKTIAVTGATGLLGRILVRAFLEADRKYELGLQVLAFCRNEKKAAVIFGEQWGAALEYVICDILKPFPMDKRADFLIHTASVTASKMMVEQPVETILTAINGTENAMRYAAACEMEGVVYLSSMEAYGITEKGEEEVNEPDLGYIDPLNIRSSYSEGKRMCECLCASFAGEYHVPVRIARLAATFGAGVDTTENRVYAQFARSILKEQDIVLHTKGDKANCYCYTTDAAAAILLLLLKGENGQAYNVANTETFCSIREMGEMFVAQQYHFNKGNSQLIIDIPEDAAKLGYAPSSVMKLGSQKLLSLGWKPQYSMEQMIVRVTDSIYRQEMMTE